jgi:hypothetical protein
MVSWMAAIASLRYFLPIIFYLYKIASYQECCKLFLRQRQHILRSFFELHLFIVVDIRLPVFGESIYEEGSGTATEEDDRPITSRSSLSWSGESLFDDAATKVSVDLTSTGTLNGIPQDHILNSFLPGKALKPFRFEDSQQLSLLYCIGPGARVQRSAG